jgi:hypothetical protein
MARRTVWLPVRTDGSPAPAARATHEDGPSTEPPEVATQSADGGVEFTEGDVANRVRPEDRPGHPLGEGVVSVEQAGHSGSLAVGFTADVAGKGCGDS